MSIERTYVCPCCGETVGADHFKRAPWTPEDMAEFLNDPRFRKVVAAMIDEALGGVAKAVRLSQSKPVPLKVAPPGMMTYADASEYLGSPIGAVRHLVFSKKLTGRAGFVTRPSVEAYKKIYHPKPTLRGPRK